MLITSFTSKADQFKQWMLKKIVDGEYQEGDRIPSDNELIRDLKLSRNTVREALACLVAEGYLLRIQGKGTYVQKKSSQLSLGKKTDVVHLIAQDRHGTNEQNPFIGEILRGILNASEQAECSIRCTTFLEAEWQASEEDIEALCADQPKGVIFAGFVVSEKITNLFKKHNVPCVSIGEPAPLAKIPYVDVNHRSGIVKAVEFLHGLGHQSIVLIDSTFHLPTHLQRKDGFEMAIQAGQLSPDQNRMITHKNLDFTFAQKETEKLLKQSQAPDALIVYGDYGSLGAIRAIESHGLKLGQDISLIMFTGYKWVCQATGVELTRVDQSRYQLGESAFQLIDGGEDNQKRLLETTFIQGQSCRTKRT